MIEYKNDKGKGRVLVKGDVCELTADILLLIHSVEEQLAEADKEHLRHCLISYTFEY